MTFVKDKLEYTKPPPNFKSNHVHIHDPTLRNHHPVSDHPELWNRLFENRLYSHEHPHRGIHVSTGEGEIGVYDEEEMPDLDLPVL